MRMLTAEFFLSAKRDLKNLPFETLFSNDSKNVSASMQNLIPTLSEGSQQSWKMTVLS